MRGDTAVAQARFIVPNGVQSDRMAMWPPSMRQSFVVLTFGQVPEVLAVRNYAGR